MFTSGISRMLNVNPATPIEINILAVLEHIQAAAVALKFQYLMIGAKAMEIQLHNVYGLPTYRPTNDTDFAVALENWGQFEVLKSYLAGTGCFKLDSRKVQRLEYTGGFPVDLVPFGGIESPGGTIAWPPDSSQVMTVQGFSEINSAAEEIGVPGSSLPVRAASLPGLALLKIFAWNDRSETKDAWDMAVLLQNYHTVVGDKRLFQDEALLRSVKYDTVTAGAVLLGKDAAAIASPATLSAAQNILLGGKRDNLIVQVASGLRAIDQENRLSTAESLLAAFLMAVKGRPL